MTDADKIGGANSNRLLRGQVASGLSHCAPVPYRYTDDGSDWFATWVGRAGQTWKEDACRAPDGFPLSQKMLAALAVAPYAPADASRGAGRPHSHNAGGGA